ncbi:MAG: DUF58 domain-containing protein [Crocinitomicaceae bacterium]|nr:DUF58 domain-containing protein [Flavobacteriales bacterium]NQZ35160.1 DUF58 domain-containing protein [Crocinitomicaceae bacterium]PHR22261.1 MAG: DUF58 domain-containing protein [Fluviicola sp.]
MSKTIHRGKLAQFGNLEILAKQVVEGFITGLHKSPFHGFSVEFAEHRLYNRGESTRHIDWKLYGRTEKLFTKKYEEETNLRCQIVIDCSTSMLYPADKEENKLEFSVYAAASIIELLRKQRDAVGLSLFTDKLNIHTPAKSSQRHHRYLFSEMENVLAQYEKGTQKIASTVECLHQIAEQCHQRSLIVIFSDLMDDPTKLDEFFQALQHLKHNKHEVILFHTVDKSAEIDFTFENRPYQFVDMETGEKIKLQPSQFKENYTKAVSAYFNDIEMRCADYRIDFMPANIGEGFNDVLLKYLLKRQKLH